MRGTIMPVSDVRKALNALLTGHGRKPVFVTQRGRVKAVLIDFDEYQRLLDELDGLRDGANPDVQRALAEGREAVRDADAAIERGDYVSWDDVRDDLVPGDHQPEG